MEAREISGLERFKEFKKQRSDDAHLGRKDFLATKSRAAIAMDNHSNIQRSHADLQKLDRFL